MDLSIIIVNWNAGDYLPGCFDAVDRNTPGIEAEVFLVDNNSADGSLEWARRARPEITIIENSENLGFAKASNIAIRRSVGRAVMLLNPDTILKPGAIEALLSLLRDDSSAGIVGPRIEYPDGTLYPQCKRAVPDIRDAFFYLFRMIGLRRAISGKRGYSLDHLDPGKTHEVGAISGSCMMIRRQVLDDTGLLDEDFFLYGEDLDLCLRAGKQGWKVYYCPEATMVHYHGESSRKRRYSSTLDFYHAMRTFYRKHYAVYRNPVVNLIVEAGISLRMVISIVMMPLRPGRRAG